MAAKLIDLSFTLNGRKVKVQIAPDTMLFALLREQGCASVRCACETTNCGLCTVWLDGDPVLSCSVPAARIEGRSITTLEGLKAESEQAIYVGDGKSDVMTAANAGIPCIYVQWGQGKVSEWRDKYEAKIVNTVEELRQILIGGENIG